MGDDIVNVPIGCVRGLDDYRFVRGYPADCGSIGDLRGSLPFSVGDRIIDDNGYVGVLASVVGQTTNGQGVVLDYCVIIRFPWDSPMYGLERVLTKGEFSLVDEKGEWLVDC